MAASATYVGLHHRLDRVMTGDDREERAQHEQHLDAEARRPALRRFDSCQLKREKKEERAGPGDGIAPPPHDDEREAGQGSERGEPAGPG